MIDLTPLDVRKKKEDFRRAVRGYDASQVDTFLDLVADRLEVLVQEHRSLAERVASLREQLTHYQEREKALNEALLAAQELREEARSQAERDAAVRLREAEAHAEAILLEADQSIRHSQRRLKEIRARRGQFIRSFRGLIQRFSEQLELEEARLEAEPDEFGDLLETLQAQDREDAEGGSGEPPRSGGAEERARVAESRPAPGGGAADRAPSPQAGGRATDEGGARSTGAGAGSSAGRLGPSAGGPATSAAAGPSPDEGPSADEGGSGDEDAGAGGDGSALAARPEGERP